MNLQELSTQIPMDLNGAMERFCGQEAIFKKYLKRIVDDAAFDNFKTATNNLDDKQQIEFTAHTLKGMFGNLGLSELYNLFSDIVNDVRSNNGSKLSELIPEAIEKTTKTFELLKELE